MARFKHIHSMAGFGVLAAMLAGLLFVSCSTNPGSGSAFKTVFNYANVGEDQLSSIAVDPSITLIAINDEKVFFKQSRSAITILISAGSYTFHMKITNNDGQTDNFDSVVTVAAHKKYLLNAKVDKNLAWANLVELAN